MYLYSYIVGVVDDVIEKYATISVPVEVKKVLEKVKGEKEWGEFLIWLYKEVRRLKGESSFMITLIGRYLNLEKYGLEISPFAILWKTGKLNNFIRKIAKNSSGVLWFHIIFLRLKNTLKD